MSFASKKIGGAGGVQGLLSLKTSSAPSSRNWSSVTYGRGKLVSVSTGSTSVMYSNDGTSWAESTLPSIKNWSSVAYGHGKFVAISSGSTSAAYSSNGTSWAASTLPSSQNWSSVTHGKNVFVAISSGSNVSAYSYDGINWNTSSIGNTQNWSSITHGGNKFVAISSGSDVSAYSYDGINWFSSTMPVSQNWVSIANGAGVFVAIASNSNTAAYSSDGVSWTSSLMNGTQNWSSIANGGGRFVVISNGSDALEYSRDGINWIANSSTLLPSVSEWSSVIYGMGMFVFVSNNSSSAAYSDLAIIPTQEAEIPIEYLGMWGRPFSESSLAGYNTAYSPVYGNGKFVMSSSAYTQYAASCPTSKIYSKPGGSWSLATGYIAHGSIAYGNGVFVCTQSNEFSSYSYDGINWLPSSMPANFNYSRVIYGNGRFIATVGADIYESQYYGAYSDNGINWTLFNTPGRVVDMVYGAGRFVVSTNNVRNDGNYSLFYYSDDGINYNISSSNIGNGDGYLSYGAGRFLARTAVSYFYSDDGGNTWNSISPPLGRLSGGVTIYAEGYFFRREGTLGDESVFEISRNGLTWEIINIIPRRFPFPNFPAGLMCYGDGKLISLNEQPSLTNPKPLRFLIPPKN